MELKILFITVLFLGASAAFSLREEQEDAANDEYEAQELQDINNDEPEYDADLEDPTKVRRSSCQKGYFLKCFVVKYCNRYLRLCRCNRFTKKYGDEAEFYNHLNDGFLETPEDEAENFDETIDEELEDPSKKVTKCPKKLIRKCFLVKDGKIKRIICTCAPPCPYKG